MNIDSLLRPVQLPPESNFAFAARHVHELEEIGRSPHLPSSIKSEELR
jgi:hypothetical protein